jgi:hypothetical protein
LRILASLAGWCLVAALVSAQAPALTTHADPPPSELAEPIKSALAPEGQRVTVGGRTLDFWWTLSLPLAAGSNEIAWSSVAEGTLVGAVRLSAAYQDIRGKTVKAGVFTLRYGVQPQNGDHLGVSPYRDFLLLAPAASDRQASPLGHDALVDVSKLALGTSHPAAWSLDPPVAAGPVLTLKKTEMGQTAVIFDVPVSRNGAAAGRLTFGLVLVGTIQS